jgi:HSP20 family protein
MAKEKETKAVVEKRKEIQKAVPARVASPFDEMERMMERVFGESPGPGWVRPWRARWPAWSELPELHMPKVDVIDRDDEIVVRAELPGVEKKDVEISTSENSVTIKGSTKHETKEEKGDFYRCEISRGAFSRTVTLPAQVDSEKGKASMRDGVLELTLPKVEKSKRRTISVD